MKYETRLSDLYQKDNPELFQEVLDFAEKNAIDKSMIEDVVVTREVIPCVKEIALEKEQKHNVKFIEYCVNGFYGSRYGKGTVIITANFIKED